MMLPHEASAKDGACIYCGVLKVSERSGEHCPNRKGAPPRATPASVFSDLGAIGERLTQIRKEEAEAVAAAEKAVG